MLTVHVIGLGRAGSAIAARLHERGRADRARVSSHGVHGAERTERAEAGRGKASRTRLAL
jgi:3-hydroxyisobutyrate dehydrogenase-like beta-hydroxyacid dehydrogenase